MGDDERRAEMAHEMAMAPGVCVCARVRSAKYRPFSNSALESEERSFSILIFGARVSTPQEASCFLYLAALPAR